MNHQANGSPVDHFDTPLDLFKGLDELGGKNENMCIFTHPNPYPTSPSPIVFGIPSTQNPPPSDLSQTTPLPSSLLICYTSSSDLRIVEIMETKFVVV
jgi:hypothetical protein